MGQWLALPYDQRDVAKELGQLFQVSGIPTLIVLGPDGKVINRNGREAVTRCPGKEGFPWAEPAAGEGGEAAAPPSKRLDGTALRLIQIGTQQLCRSAVKENKAGRLTVHGLEAVRRGCDAIHNTVSLIPKV